MRAIVMLPRHLRAFGTPRITRTEKDGEITVLADKFEGKRLNAPNDIAVESDELHGSPFPSATANGGQARKSPNRPPPTSIASPRTANSPRFSPISSIKMALDFSPTKELYVVKWEGHAQRSIWAMKSTMTETPGMKTKIHRRRGSSRTRRLRLDRDGNLWYGYGSNRALQAEPTEIGGRKVFQLKGKSEDLDGVMVFNPEPSRSPSSACLNAAPISPSAGRRITASTWRAVIPRHIARSHAARIPLFSKAASRLERLNRGSFSRNFWCVPNFKLLTSAVLEADGWKLEGSDMAKIAFLGLGVMGFPMAGHLVAKGGHQVTVFNRTSAKAMPGQRSFVDIPH